MRGRAPEKAVVAPELPLGAGKDVGGLVAMFAATHAMKRAVPMATRKVTKPKNTKPVPAPAPKPDVPTFLQLAEEVMKLRDEQGIRGLDRELSRFRCHIVDVPFANTPITDIRAPDIREWLRLMSQKNAAGYGPVRKLARPTINRCESLVSAVFQEAIERELIETNPCSGVVMKKRVDESDTVEKWAFLTIEEQRRLASCAAIPLADRLAIRFAIATGMRQGEQRHLEIPDLIVDDEKPRVIVRYAGRRKGAKLPPKSGKRRTIPLFGDGLEAAREWLAMLPSFAPDNPENLVFPTAAGKIRFQGKPLGRSGTLKAHYVAAGIKLRPGLHWHALRHTCASNLVTGVLGRTWSLQEVQKIMGHSSVQITERYAHVDDNAIEKAARETAPAARELPAATVESKPTVKPAAYRPHVAVAAAVMLVACSVGGYACSRDARVSDATDVRAFVNGGDR